MAEITNQEFHPSELESLQHGEAQDFTFLLRVLDYDPSKTVQDHVTLKAVEPRLQRAVDSDTTTVYTVRRQPDCPILATGTLSRAEILTGKGARMWVDDVVTRPDWQGKGMFTQIMNAMEEKAALSADEVYLTSSPERGPARSRYTKREYDLFPYGLGVYRNAKLQHDQPDGTKMVTDASSSDIEQMAGLLGEDPVAVRANINGIFVSPYSALFAKKERGVIMGVSVANLCPIPTGYKPWIDDLAAVGKRDQLDALQASEAWLAAKGAPYANVVDTTGTGLSDDYSRRSSGLFIKQAAHLKSVASAMLKTTCRQTP